MADTEKDVTKTSRREAFGIGSAALAATLAMMGREDANAQTPLLASHNAPNESDPGPQNRASGGGESGFGMGSLHR